MVPVGTGWQLNTAIVLHVDILFLVETILGMHQKWFIYPWICERFQEGGNGCMASWEETSPAHLLRQETNNQQGIFNHFTLQLSKASDGSSPPGCLQCKSQAASSSSSSPLLHGNERSFGTCFTSSPSGAKPGTPCCWDQYAKWSNPPKLDLT